MGWENESLFKRSRSHDQDAAMPIYDKNLKNLLLQNQKADDLETWYAAWVLEYYQVCSNDDPGWPWRNLRQGQIWSLMLLYGKKVKKKGFFRNYCRLWFEISNRWPKWQDFSVDINTLSPGCVCPLPRGYIHVLYHEKNCIKSDFKEISLKLATNEWSDKTFLLTSKPCPLWTVCPCSEVIYMYKIMKKLYKVRLQRDFFRNLQQMTEVTRCYCWHQNFVPWGCLPLICGYIHLLNHEMMCIKSKVEEILFKLAQTQTQTQNLYYSLVHIVYSKRII